MEGEPATIIYLEEHVPLRPIDNWLEVIALGDNEQALDYVENMTIPEDLMDTFPASLQKMHKAFFDLIFTALQLDAYYARWPDPKVEKLSVAQYKERELLAHMFLRLLLCPRGLLLTLEDKDGDEFLVTYSRLGPFCRASDAEQAFELLWDEKVDGWEDTEFKRQNIEEACAQYCATLQEFDPGQPLYNRKAVFKMSKYREKLAKLYEKVDLLSSSKAKASKEFSAEQNKAAHANQVKLAELEDYHANCSTQVGQTVKQLEILDRKMKVQYQIEKFLTCRSAGEPCPRLKFEHPEKEEEDDSDATARPAESNDADIMTDIAGLSDALNDAIAASRDEWDMEDIAKEKLERRSRSRRYRRSRSRSESEDRGKGKGSSKGKGKKACYDEDTEE